MVLDMREDILDLVTSAVGARRRSFGYRYYDGAEVDIARKAAVRIHNLPRKTDDAIIRILSDEMSRVERPYYSNPNWDGSIA